MARWVLDAKSVNRMGGGLGGLGGTGFEEVFVQGYRKGSFRLWKKETSDLVSLRSKELYPTPPISSVPLSSIISSLIKNIL